MDRSERGDPIKQGTDHWDRAHFNAFRLELNQARYARLFPDKITRIQDEVQVHDNEHYRVWMREQK